MPPRRVPVFAGFWIRFLALSFDVLLIVEFTDKDAHDAYLVDPRHRAVVDAWTPRLRGIRVLDAAR